MPNITYTVIVEFGSQTCRRDNLTKKEAARLIKAGWQHDADEILWKRSDMPLLLDYYDTVMCWD